MTRNLTSPFELIKKSVNIFSKKENLIFFLKIYWPLIPFAGISLVQQYLLIKSGIDINAVWWLGVTSLLQIIYLFVLLLVMIMGIMGIKKVLSGESLSVKSCLKDAKSKYWKFLLLTSVLCLLYVFGFALLIIPGMLFVVWFIFARFITLDSNLKIKEILVKSRGMTKGLYWKILGRLLVFGLFTFSVQLIFSFVPYGLGAFLTPLMGALFLLPLYLLYKEVSG